MTRLGLWIDDPVSEIKKASYWKEVKKHGFQTAAIMLEGIGHGFDPKLTLQDLNKIKDLAVIKNDIELVLTIWPEPSKLYLDELEKEIPKYIDSSGCSALEFDLEGNWTPGRVKGFSNLDKAGDRLVEICDKLRSAFDIRIEVTTFTMHTENSKKADVATHADRLLPQAYSVRHRDEGEEPWDGKYGPGNMQKLTLGRTLTIPNRPKLSCGLAAYDQVWPGKSGQEAMQAAYDKALEYYPEEIRYWSSKWIIGVRKNGYASKFILSLNKGK